MTFEHGSPTQLLLPVGKHRGKTMPIWLGERTEQASEMGFWMFLILNFSTRLHWWHFNAKLDTAPISGFSQRQRQEVTSVDRRLSQAGRFGVAKVSFCVYEKSPCEIRVKTRESECLFSLNYFNVILFVPLFNYTNLTTSLTTTQKIMNWNHSGGLFFGGREWSLRVLAVADERCSGLRVG